jgi:hypothetical protein
MASDNESVPLLHKLESADSIDVGAVFTVNDVDAAPQVVV